MENQKQVIKSPASYNRNKKHRREFEKSFGYGKYKGRKGKHQPRGERFQKSADYQAREDKFGKRNSKFQSRHNRLQNKKQPIHKRKGFRIWRKEQKIRIVSDMQITEGKHRGKYLQSTTSPKVRPTARRIREAMFKIIHRRVRAKRFLDLCAGAGTVGIEAISRGAILATFVERSAKMCSFIKKNLEACGIKIGHGEVVEMEVLPFLKRMAKRRRFWDIVYFDPPYDSDYEETLNYFKRGTAVAPGGILIIEHHAEMFFPEKLGVLKRWRVVSQGDSAITFYERK
jgi:16S rRNA (guanine(966)-N(2))-methyltransferase RsmD